MQVVISTDGPTKVVTFHQLSSGHVVLTRGITWDEGDTLRELGVQAIRLAVQLQ